MRSTPELVVASAIGAMLTLGVGTASAASTQFENDYVGIQASGNPKCSSNSEIVIQPFSLDARCAETWCSRLITLPLRVSTQSCDNKSIQYTNESVAPYVTGWRFKAPYNDVAMAGSFTQVQHLEVRLVNWQVRGAEVDVEFIYSMLHSDNVNYPDWTDVWVTLELFAANPDSDVVLRRRVGFCL